MLQNRCQWTGKVTQCEPWLGKASTDISRGVLDSTGTEKMQRRDTGKDRHERTLRAALRSKDASQPHRGQSRERLWLYHLRTKIQYAGNYKISCSTWHKNRWSYQIFIKINDPNKLYHRMFWNQNSALLFTGLDTRSLSVIAWGTRVIYDQSRNFFLSFGGSSIENEI